MLKKYKYPYDERFTEKYLYSRLGWVNNKEYIHSYISKHHSWLHGLHLDFYIPQWHQAIELNGRQHSHLTNWNGQVSYTDQQINLFKQTGRDLIKQNLCLRHGIHIIYVNTDFSRKRTIRKHIINVLNDKLKPIHKRILHKLTNKSTYNHRYNMRWIQSIKNIPINTTMINRLIWLHNSIFSTYLILVRCPNNVSACIINQRVLAECLHVSVRTIRRCIKNLVKCNAIAVINIHGRLKAYITNPNLLKLNN